MHTIGTGTSKVTTAQNAQALHFLRHHLCSTLKNEYMAERSALDLWNALKQRFERLKYTVCPRAEAEWMRLRFQDFKTVGEYNSALHRICTSLQLCGVTITDSQKIEKTLHFPPKCCAVLVELPVAKVDAVCRACGHTPGGRSEERRVGKECRL